MNYPTNIPPLAALPSKFAHEYSKYLPHLTSSVSPKIFGSQTTFTPFLCSPIPLCFGFSFFLVFWGDLICYRYFGYELICTYIKPFSVWSLCEG